MNKAEQFADAKVRALALMRKMTAESAARRMAAEFDICIYAAHGGIYGSFYETDRNEVVVRLA